VVSLCAEVHGARDDGEDERWALVETGMKTRKRERTACEIQTYRSVFIAVLRIQIGNVGDEIDEMIKSSKHSFSLNT
jgi:hypothetical protein